VKLPPGQELPFIAGRLSDQALHLEHLHSTVQTLTDHIAELTSRLVLFQTEIRNGMKDLRTETNANRAAVQELSAHVLVLQHSIGALRQKSGVLPLPPE
jgi:uncharacterized protein YaaN involved in tellurite resistance